MGAFPANGSQLRSFVLAETGARTQMANVVATVLVVLTLLFLAPAFDYLPTVTLAAIVMVAGFGLLDLAEFRSLWRYRRSEFWMAVITIAGVLGLGMLFGILIAIGLSLLLVLGAPFGHWPVRRATQNLVWIDDDHTIEFEALHRLGPEHRKFRCLELVHVIDRTQAVIGQGRADR